MGAAGVPDPIVEWVYQVRLAPPAVNTVAVVNWQYSTGETTVGPDGFALIVSVVLLGDPVVAGSVETTRTLYAVPLAVPPGIVTVNGLDAPEGERTTGVVKSPAAFDNCTLNSFPTLKVPVAVKGTLSVELVQTLVTFNASVPMV
jgi:hypothetical protein